MGGVRLLALTALLIVIRVGARGNYYQPSESNSSLAVLRVLGDIFTPEASDYLKNPGDTGV